MPLSGNLPNPYSGLSLWPASFPYVALLAVALILFCARWYNQGCKSSGDGSQQSRTMPTEKDGAGAPQQQQRGVEAPEEIKSDMQLSSETQPPLPPISDAAEAVLSHEYTISFPDNTGAGTHSQTTQTHEEPQYYPRPTLRQGHSSSYYQDTPTYAFEPNWSSTTATSQTSRNLQPTIFDDNNNDSNTSFMRQYPTTSFNPPTQTIHSPTESVNPGMYREFNPAGLHHHYPLPSVTKQRESLQVFRGVGQEKGRTWRRKVLEYS